MELNQLELEFLIFNDFNLHVTLEELQRTGDALMAHATELYPRSVVNERGMLLRELSPKAVPQPRHYRDDSGSPGGLGGSGGGNGASFQPSVTAMSGQSQYNGPNASGPSANYDGRQAFFGQQASPPYDRDGMPSRSHSAAAPLQPHPPIHVQPDPSAGAYPPSPAASDETKTQHGSRKGSTDPFEARRPLYGSPQSPVRMEGVETVFPANAALGTGMATDYDTPMHFGTPPGSVVTG